MASIAGAAERMADFVGGFSSMLEQLLARSTDTIPEVIRAQLTAGQDGYGEPIRPVYASENYMRYKAGVTPPQSVPLLGLPARDASTPNLLLSGRFHGAMEAVVEDNGVKVVNTKTPYADRLEGKYGEAIYRVGDAGKKYLFESVFREGILDYYRTFGWR